MDYYAPEGAGDLFLLFCYRIRDWVCPNQVDWSVTRIFVGHFVAYCEIGRGLGFFSDTLI